MLSKKELVLLESLISQAGNYISSLDLAARLSMTDRTARKYLKLLTELVIDKGARIEAKQGYGYRLVIDDQVAFQSFWQNCLQSRHDLQDIRQVEASEDRQRYILNRLFFGHHKLSFDELRGELYISKTTLSTDLQRLRKLLSTYNLSLSQNRLALEVLGEETAIRHFLLDYFVDKHLGESLLATVVPSFLGQVNVSDLLLIVLEECRQAQLRLSDFVLHNLVLHLALMIRRLNQGYPLTVSPAKEELGNRLEYQVALKILYRVEGLLQIRIPLEEARYIALHLSGKQSQLTSERLAKGDTDSLDQQIDQALRQLGQKLDMALQADVILQEGLLAHFGPFLTRLKHGISLSNPLLEDIQSRYGEILDLVRRFFSQLPSLRNQLISDDEWAYISIHVIAALERLKQQRQLRVLVVCATGVGSATMLKTRLETEFGNQLVIQDVVSYYDITKAELDQVDVIISSLNLPDHLFLTPVLQVSVFLTQEDVANIKAYLANNAMVSLTPPVVAKSQNHLSLLRPEQFIVFTEKISKDDVLTQLIGLLDSDSSPDFVDMFRQQLQTRESYGSVVYGESLAFPHPVLPLTDQEQVVVAVCQQELYWDDEHPAVHFVFLLSPSKTHNPHLKQVSANLVAFVTDQKAQECLLKNPSHQQLISLFQKLL